MQERWDHFIDGHAVPPKSARYLDDHNPATGEKIAEVARGDSADVDAAVAAARAAFAGWRDRRPIERGRILLEIARKIREKSRELSEIERLETGKPAVQVPFEIEVAAQYFELYGGLVNAIHGETIDLGPGYHSYTRREPFGVVGVILPWNAPLNQAGRAVAPALAAGNTVVAKPSEFTSASLLELARLAVEECGLPRGVLNVVTGSGQEAGAALVAHRDVRKVAFTGSVRAGREVGRIAAERIIPLTLELGGKSPNIVFADADLDAAVRGATIGIFYGKGEVCAAGSRLFVEKKIHDDFMHKLVDRAKKVQPGDPLDPKTRFGALVSERQMHTVLGYIEKGKAEGARLVAGGERSSFGNGKGCFVQPTIFDGVRNDMTIAREEIFGPVLAGIEFGEMDEAIRLANETQYGLAAAVWTRDIGKAHRVARKLQAGTVWINTYNNYDAAAAFGGYKMSGYGRELGMHALEHYTQIKSVWVNLA